MHPKTHKKWQCYLNKTKQKLYSYCIYCIFVCILVWMMHEYYPCCFLFFYEFCLCYKKKNFNHCAHTHTHTHIQKGKILEPVYRTSKEMERVDRDVFVWDSRKTRGHEKKTLKMITCKRQNKYSFPNRSV